MDNIRVLVVDDNEAIRTAVSLYLSTCDDIETVGEASNGREAIEQTHLTQPDVILMDLNMPVMNGVAATSVIHRQYPQIPILVLTSSVELDLLQAIRNAGAVGHLLKYIPAERIVKAIRNVHRHWVKTRSMSTNLRSTHADRDQKSLKPV
jgi:two-component system, NarL family, response regulator LiaR